MAYTLDISIALGGSKSGLTLQVQFVDSSGTNVGSPVTSGIVEIGGGFYLWHASITDGFRGGAKVTTVAAPATVLAFLTINPEEAENVDEKITDAAASTPPIDISVGHSTSGVQIEEGSVSAGPPDIHITTNVDDD